MKNIFYAVFLVATFFSMCLMPVGAYADFSIFGITPATEFPEGVVGEAYSLQLGTTGGGVAPLTWSIVSGALPEGLGIGATTGVISGTPTTATSSSFTVQVQDANGAVATQTYALSVYPSVGGFSYSRIPSGNLISNPVTIHVKGVFGADFCDASSDGYNIYVWGPQQQSTQTVHNVLPGTVEDRDFVFTLPSGTYNDVFLQCYDDNNSRATQTVLESGDFLLTSNQAPQLAAIGDKTIDEGQTLTFTVSATDPDGDTLTYTASNLPSGASFDPSTQTFTWTPGYGQAGNYTNVEFTVLDNGTPMKLDTQLITITVGHVNRPPVFAAVGPQTASTTISMSFGVSATDPDGDAVALSAFNVPSGATFDTSTGLFSWTPAYDQTGVYTVTFVATDNGTPTIATSSIGVVISVSTSTPTTVTQSLVTQIVSAGYPTSQLNSYLANLQKVVIFIDNGQIQPAINQLNAFIQKVNQDYKQGLLTQVEYEYLIGEAQSIIASLQQ